MMASRGSAAAATQQRITRFANIRSTTSRRPLEGRRPNQVQPPRGFFRFGGAKAEDNELAQCREDYRMADAEDYFNYMGLLAVDGTYDRLEEMVSAGLDPMDLMMCMAVEEGDKPKVAELLKNGADAGIEHPLLGKKLVEIPKDDAELLDMLRGAA